MPYGEAAVIWCIIGRKYDNNNDGAFCDNKISTIFSASFVHLKSDFSTALIKYGVLLLLSPISTDNFTVASLFSFFSIFMPIHY